MSENNEIAIKVQHIGKTFHEQAGSRSFKEAFVGVGRKLTGKIEKKLSGGDYAALKDINFEVKKGEFFGIVGRNGSGKSTLLKIIAGVYTPSKGAVTINGNLTPFIELGVGFNPELSGHDNVFLNGALLGFTRKQMQVMYDDIVDFAELHDFMGVKLKNYSSGMQVRLAFSVAIRAESEILLIDEVLAVGDAAFQQKCFSYFEKLKKDKKTIILVTHDMDAVRRFCNKALYIQDGVVKRAGKPEDVANMYLIKNMETGQLPGESEEQDKNITQKLRSLKARAISKPRLKPVDDLEFYVEYVLNKDIDVDLGYSIINNGFSVAEQNTKLIKLPKSVGLAHKIQCKISLKDFNSGSYSLDIAIFEKSDFSLIGHIHKVAQFIIVSPDNTRGGAMRVDGRWEVEC